MGPTHEQESPLRFFEAQTPENIRLARRRQQIRLNEPLPFPRSTFESTTSSVNASDSRQSLSLGSRRLVSYGRATIGKHGDEGPLLVPPLRHGCAGFGFRSRMSFGESPPQDTVGHNPVPSRSSLQSDAQRGVPAPTNNHRRTLSSNIEPTTRTKITIQSPTRPFSSVEDIRAPSTATLTGTRCDGGGRAKLEAVEAQYLANTFESELRKRMRRFRALQSPKAQSINLIYNSREKFREPGSGNSRLVFRVESARDQVLDTDLCIDPKDLISILDDLLIRCETGLRRRGN